ncbi:hypothetical protein GCM10022224_005340 [Nonomuraea antimicrobica]|uniref:DUF4367 domain-containing protein n=1 Tax=Nonomuraea antimicrobica TaxID=561173 RepID=A0ABP7B295_9ACTN
MNSRDPEPGATESHDALEAELAALGDLLDVPGPPPADVAAAVRARLEQPDPAHGPIAVPVRPHMPAPHGRRAGRWAGRRPGRAGRRARWAIVAAVVVVVVTLTAATPQGRAAVAQILRFAGIELRIGDTPPPPVATTAPMPGERTVSPADLPGQVRFQVRTPAALGPPQRITVADNGRVVSMFWPDGTRLDQFDGALAGYFFKKLGPPFPDHAVVNGRDAWWIPGAHPLGYLEREDGTEVPLRQAGPTLIWQQGALNHRLEGVRDKAEAVRIATSLR